MWLPNLWAGQFEDLAYLPACAPNVAWNVRQSGIFAAEGNLCLASDRTVWTLHPVGFPHPVLAVHETCKNSPWCLSVPMCHLVANGQALPWRNQRASVDPAAGSGLFCRAGGVDGVSMKIWAPVRLNAHVYMYAKANVVSVCGLVQGLCECAIA